MYPNEGKFVSSDKQERYAFNSFFTVDMKDFSIANDQEVDPLPEIVKSYDYFGEIMGMVFRIILTLLVELTLAILFFSKKSKIFKTRLHKHIYIRKKVSFIENDPLCNGCDFRESEDKCNYLWWPCKIAS